MPKAAQAPAQQQAPGPGAYFDIPGIPGGSTAWTEADDSTTSANIALSSSSQVQIQTILPFRQTDVVADWIVSLFVQQTYTTGTSTLTASAYAPMNAVGPVQLAIQNQYNSLDVESGIDWYLFSLIRPYSRDEADSGTNLGANPAGFPVGGSAQGYPAAALAQPNLINAAQWSTATTAYTLFLRVPAGQWFDNYYDLTIDGQLLSQGHPALVSPQYMAGTTRVISPKITMNPGNASTTDLGAVNISAGTGTFAGQVTARIRRKAIYASGNGTILPPVYPWQYRQKTTRYGIGAVSSLNLPIPLDSGQVMSVYVRLFDPAAASALGAPISLTALGRVSYQFGSGLFTFDAQTNGGVTCGALLQRRWLQNHPQALPQGVFAFDFARDERGQVSNKRLPNTLTTAGLNIRLEFTGVQSASSYAVMGVESLVYVS